MPDIGVKDSQFAGCLDGGTNTVLAWGYRVHSRNVTQVRFPVLAMLMLDSGGWAGAIISLSCTSPC